MAGAPGDGGGGPIASAFVFASDLADEGIGTVLANLQERAGLDGLMPAFTYHAARDIFPHNPRRKLAFLDQGEHFFQPDSSLYDGQRIQPRVNALGLDGDVLGETCARARERGMCVRAWTVFLHLDRPDVADCCTRTAFGDVLGTDLCPANPHVRAYVHSLVRDVARFDVESIVAESLHYHGLEHGSHHERYFVELGATARYLLGLCFCDHCVARAESDGVDARRVAATVVTELERVFDRRDAVVEGELERERLAELADGGLGAYLDVRARTVTTLATEAAAIARELGRGLTFIELSGAVKGYAHGRPTGPPVVEAAWRQGVDPAEVAAACDELEVLGYAAEVDRFRLDLAAYRALLAGTPLAVAVRPSPPDCTSAADLAAKVQAAAQLGVERIDFYHYGFLRLEALDWIREALGR